MSNLILVPTPGEAHFVRDCLVDELKMSASAGDSWSVQICGFGPIAAAARTSVLIGRFSPNKIVLLGIAGSFDLQRLPIGTASEFHEVVCHGVGIGTGNTHKSASTLGWKLFDGDDVDREVTDRLRLQSGLDCDDGHHDVLLTSPTASADEDDVRRRMEAFPDAVAEDMEGFAVALACSIASTPLCIVRGISNRVGDRDKNQWKMDDAMKSACEKVRLLVGGSPS